MIVDWRLGSGEVDLVEYGLVDGEGGIAGPSICWVDLWVCIGVRAEIVDIGVHH